MRKGRIWLGAVAVMGVLLLAGLAGPALAIFYQDPGGGGIGSGGGSDCTNGCQTCIPVDMGAACTWANGDGFCSCDNLLLGNRTFCALGGGFCNGTIVH